MCEFENNFLTVASLSIYLFIHVSKLQIIAQQSSSLSYSHDIQLILIVHNNEDSQLDKEVK